MCGIISYVGNKQALPFLIDGLKRLEYRGYDSAGVAILSGDELFLAKEKGRVAQLASRIDPSQEGSVGIAHTRWATHGVPNQTNAHPHSDCSGSTYVVHNGIIENYRDLRARLEKSGHIFVSQTDTETLSHLIEDELADETVSLFQAVQAALTHVKGAYGIAVISSLRPGTLVVAKNGSPLMLGVGEHEFFAASDASALLQYTKQVVYLDDGEVAEITTEGYRIASVNDINTFIQKEAEQIEWDQASIQKKGFDHFFLKELTEQPEVVRDTMRGRLIVDEGLAHLGGLDQISDRLREIERMVIISCGTARYAGLVGEYMLEEYAGIPVDVEYASEFRYRKPLIDKKTAYVFISQSGETADTIAALQEVKRKGGLTLGIVNVVGSSIARLTDAGVYTHAGPEISVASTKAFMTQMTVLAILTLQFGRMRDMSVVFGKRIASELTRLPDLMQQVIDTRDQIEQIAKKYESYKNFLFLGRKYNFPIALEGALKLKELSYIHAEGYATGEMKHGPIAMIDPQFPSVCLAPQDSVYDKVTSGMEELKARGGKIIAIATEGDKRIAEIADDVIYIPKTLEMLTPFLSVIPLQLFAYYVACAKQLDVDKPRNLAKSVTVE